jgi:hypothetical protein
MDTYTVVSFKNSISKHYSLLGLFSKSMYPNTSSDFFVPFLENGKRKRTLDITDSRQGISGSPPLPLPPPHSSLYHKSSVQTSPPSSPPSHRFSYWLLSSPGVMKEGQSPTNRFQGD